MGLGNIITGCEEVCGDGRSYLKSLKLKAEVPTTGGQPILNSNECDDGNVANGDGCSSSCKIETGFACLTAEDTGLNNGKCVTKTKIILQQDNKNQNPLLFELSFSRKTNLTPDKLTAQYKMIITETSGTVLDNIVFSTIVVSEKQFRIDILGTQFTKNMVGILSFKKKLATTSSSVPGTRILLDSIKDEEMIDLDLEEAK